MRAVPSPVLAALCVLALAALGACAKEEKRAGAPLTEHQRDSVLATQPLPGAPAVGGALKAAEGAAARAAGMDSLGR